VFTSKQEKNPLKKFRDMRKFVVTGAESVAGIVSNDVISRHIIT